MVITPSNKAADSPIAAQVALFLIPVLTLLAWCIGKPLSLLFDSFQSIVGLTVSFSENADH